MPHPSGYPTYQLLLRVAIALFPGEPARAGNWPSALCAAAAVGLFADLAGRMLARMVSITPALSAVAALAAAVTWAVSPTFWGRRSSLRSTRSTRWPWSRCFGCSGAGGRPSMRVRGLSLAGRRRRGVGFRSGQPPVAPADAARGGHLVVGRAEARRRIPGSGLLAVLGAAVVALGVYAYLPLMAVATPPVNWEDPRTPQALWALVRPSLPGIDLRAACRHSPTGCWPGRRRPCASSAGHGPRSWRWQGCGASTAACTPGGRRPA